MAGSRKGEKRGAAGRTHRKRRVPHETVGEIMDQASKGRARRKVIDRRLEVARIIHGGPSLAIDMSMKEIMTDGARYFKQAALDWQRFGDEQARIIPPTKQSTQAVLLAEQKAEYYTAQAIDAAFKAAPYLHAKQAPAATRGDAGESARTILDDLLDDIDAKMRENTGLLIEHEPVKKVG